ncbi:hypothetical protein G6F24_014819 [Rhizopus arrhizus]|nr:hypothetical protein G6F24_014819 [Rhizopus arrhizus]
MDGDDHEAVQIQFQAEAGFVPAQRAHQRIKRPFRLGFRPRIAVDLQQHVAAAVELGRRLQFADQEGMGIVRTQGGDGADREAGREAATQTGSHDLIAHFHTSAERNVAQFQFVAAAVDDQAHAVAGHGDRYRVVGVGQQQHGGGAPGDADHLAHQAAGIDHRLPDMHAFAAAGVEHQPLLHRVQVDVQHRCQLHIQATALGHVQQFAQLGVVQRGGLQAAGHGWPPNP